MGEARGISTGKRGSGRFAADVLVLSVLLLPAVTGGGCSTAPAPGRPYVAPTDGGSAVRAVHRALDSMQYATASAAYDEVNNYVVSAFDRDGNNVVVTISPSNGQATPIMVSVEPGQNDSLRQQIIRVIDRELRR